MPCLKSVRTSNTHHHRMRRAGGGSNACILVDFKAVHRCKLDLWWEMARCGWGIDSSGCRLEMVIYLSAKPDLLLLAIPVCPKTFTGIPWPRRDVFLLARQEVSAFAAWGAEELILWWIFWEVCPSTSAQGVLSREMFRQGCLCGITPRPPPIPHPAGHQDQVGGYLTPKTPSCQLKV